MYLVRRLSLGLATVSAGNYVAIALAFVTNVFLTRTLGPHEFGRLALLLMASQISLLFTAQWSQAALVRFGAREHSAHGVVARTFWDRLVLMAPAGAVLAGAMVFLAPVIAEYLAVPVAALWLVAAHVVVGAIFATGISVLQATQRMSRYGVALVVDRAAGLIFVVVASRLWSLDAVGALVAYVAGTAVAALWLFVAIREVVFVRIPLDRARIAELARFSFPLIAGTWAGLFGSQWVDLVIIRQLLPLTEVGRYSLAYQISGAVQQLTAVAGTILIPRLSALVAEGDSAEIDAIYSRVIPYWLLVYSVGVGVLIGATQFLLPLVFGAPFADATDALRLLLAAAVIAGLFTTFQPLLMAHGIVWPLSAAVGIAIVVNIALDLLLIPGYGIAGSAFATIVSYSASAAVALVTVSARLGRATLRYLVFALPPLAAASSCALFSGIGLAAAFTISLAASAYLAARVFALWPAAPFDLRSDGAL